jgi:hypothetical protein
VNVPSALRSVCSMGKLHPHFQVDLQTYGSEEENLVAFHLNKLPSTRNSSGFPLGLLSRKRPFKA